MNNKPYGWHCFIGKGKEEQDFLFINGKGASKPDASWDKVIPLYTHPVKEQGNPVAWRKQLDTGVYMYQEYCFGEAEPLYTHPVKELTISNNEIHKEFLKLIENCDPKLSIGDVGFPALIEDFARAILRKAQK